LILTIIIIIKKVSSFKFIYINQQFKKENAN
jgi:hypothetical protein